MPGQPSAAGEKAVGTADGVALPPPRQGNQPSPEEMIAAAAVDELPSRGTVLLDAGPVAEFVARSLPEGCALTVVTNSVSVAVALTAYDDITTLLIGGRIQREAGATVGGPGTAGLEDLHVDVAFMAADGVSAQRGLTTRSQVEREAKRMMMRAADHVVLLAEAERIGHVRLARFGFLSDVDCLVTDSSCDFPAGRRVAVSVPRLVRV